MTHGTLSLSREDAKQLWLALGTRAFMLHSTGHPTGAVKSLQGRVDNIWTELEHAEKGRNSERHGEDSGSAEVVLEND